MFLNFFAYGKFGSHGRIAIYWISRNNGPRCIGATLYLCMGQTLYPLATSLCEGIIYVKIVPVRFDKEGSEQV